jgi:hypothetical protein
MALSKRALFSVTLLLVIVSSFAILEIGAAPGIAFEDPQDSTVEPELRTFERLGSVCDGESYTNVTSSSTDDGRHLTFNATFRTESAVALDAEFTRTSNGAYRLSITSSLTEGDGCGGVVEYRAVVVIPDEKPYSVTVAHDGQTAYVANGSDGRSGVEGASSGSS